MKQKAVKASGGSDNATVVVQTEKQSWWQSLDPEQRRRINTIAIGLGISLIAATTIFFGIRLYRNQVAKHEENRSLGRNKHSTWAKLIQNAFDNNGWPGTDEKLLRDTLREIPSKEDFRKVQASYRRLFRGDNLVEEMTGELKQSEYNEMLAIINSKPEKAKDAQQGAVIYDPHGWAKRLNAAFNYRWGGFFWGTDEEAVEAVIAELPTQQAYLDTAVAYLDLYGVTLETDIAGDLSSSEIEKYRQIIRNKPRK
ncbi:MAG: hypothetical protein HUJ25_12490 [Crocinitomicaceae bacterium]|nr:hypothetical protein [Crocinitomicaceae bacterium]